MPYEVLRGYIRQKSEDTQYGVENLQASVCCSGRGRYKNSLPMLLSDHIRTLSIPNQNLGAPQPVTLGHVFPLSLNDRLVV